MTIQIDPNAQHAVYSMSSGGRWAGEDKCTASPEAIAMLPPQVSGEEAEEGREAHLELERRLGPLKGDFVNPATMPIAPADPEHPSAFSVEMMINYVRKLPPGRMWVEQRVALTDQIWGTADVQHWEDETRILTIPDLKNGQRAVDPEKEQLRLYGAASMFTHSLPVKWFRFAVVQPFDWRPFVPRVKQHVESVDSLYAWASKVAAIPRSLKVFRAGAHCRDCPLFGKCDASIDMITNIGALIAGLVQPDQVRPEQVAAFLHTQKPVEDAYKNFKKYWDTKSLKANTAPPAMKFVETIPHRAWTDIEAAKALIVKKLGVKGLDVPTPAQAIERGLPEDVVHKMAPKPKGGPALAFENDKRKAWAPVSAQEMFAGVVGAAGKK